MAGSGHHHGQPAFKDRATEFERVLSEAERSLSGQAVETVGSYEDALLRLITSGKRPFDISNEALMFGAIVSSLSPALSNLQYKAGMNVGRALYRSISQGAGYMFPEESVASLVSFLQAAGYRYVTYAVFADRTEIKIFDKKGPAIGARVHGFEAGIIAGFLSAATHRVVYVSEVECIQEGASSCRFVSGHAAAAHHGGTVPASISSLDLFAKHIASVVHGTRPLGSWAVSAGFSSEYYTLFSAEVFGRENADGVKAIASYLGTKVSANLVLIGRGTLRGKVRLDDIASSLRLLNFGEPHIKSRKPVRMGIGFSRPNSRKEFVDVALAFINGMLSNSTLGEGSHIAAHERTSGGAYRVDVSEHAPAK